MYLRLFTRSLQTKPTALFHANAGRLASVRTISDDAAERKAKYLDKLRQKAEE